MTAPPVRRVMQYPLTRAALAAGEDLAILHELAAELGAPCIVGDVLDPVTWTSDDLADLAAARAACQHCPVLEECTSYGRTHRPRAGQWGDYPSQLHRRKEI